MTTFTRLNGMDFSDRPWFRNIPHLFLLDSRRDDFFTQVLLGHFIFLQVATARKNCEL